MRSGALLGGAEPWESAGGGLGRGSAKVNWAMHSDHVDRCMSQSHLAPLAGGRSGQWNSSLVIVPLVGGHRREACGRAGGTSATQSFRSAFRLIVPPALVSSFATIFFHLTGFLPAPTGQGAAQGTLVASAGPR